jgi:predicted Zn-dependent peptidase
MSSRLFQEVRERRGLAYSVYSFTQSLSDSGLFSIYAGTGSDEAAEVVPVICEEVKKVMDSVSAEEVRRSRAQIKAGILMSLESTNARCEQLARQLMVHGRILSIEELVSKIEAVDEAAVVRVANRLFSTRPTFAAIGPLANVTSYDDLCAALRT